MAYLWSDYDRNATYCISEKPASPFEERLENIDEDAVVRINPVCRFAGIFLPLLHYFETLNAENQELAKVHEAASTRSKIENILLHVLAQIDRTSGIHDFTLEEDRLEKSILAGMYGEPAQKAFASLARADQLAILHLLRRQEEEKGRVSYFVQALQALFPGANYYYYEFEERFLICIPQEKSPEGENRLLLLQDLFLDLSCREPEIFWNSHFGIIGRNDTMQLDKMVIF